MSEDTVGKFPRSVLQLAFAAPTIPASHARGVYCDARALQRADFVAIDIFPDESSVSIPANAKH